MDFLRRDFLVGVGVVLLAGMLGGCQPANSQTAKLKRPSIVFILTDDLGYGDLSCYGQQKFRTPNIDRLAQQGIKFTDFYAGSTVCAPSRCSLMTGLHTGHCQIRGNLEMQPEGQYPLKAQTIMISTLLKEAGYKTGIFGKWGLGNPGSSGDPMNYFEEFYGYNCQRLAHNYYPEYLWHNRQKIMLNGKTYSHDLILDAAKSFIRTNKDKPFFCYMPVTIPHAAMHAPADLHEKYRQQFPQFEDKTGTYAGPAVSNPVAAFPAMVEHLDNGIGEIMQLLKELDIEEKTIVLFSSDNGPHREGGHDPDFFDSNGPLRGYKRDLYEGGIRVPMLIRWPEKIEPGRVTSQVSAFWDVLPTVTDIAGIESPNESIDGISFVPTLLDQPGRQKQHRYLYWEFHEQGGKQAVRMGQWKAVRLNVKKDPASPIELYDLENDLGETNNMADEHPEMIQQMKKIMTKARTENDVFRLQQTAQ